MVVSYFGHDLLSVLFLLQTCYSHMLVLMFRTLRVLGGGLCRAPLQRM